MNRLAKPVLSALLLVSVSACNRQTDWARVPVQGAVTFQGKPVERGLITFRPAPGVRGPAAGAGIVDGRYQISEDKGPIAAAYEVEIKVAESADKPNSTRPSAGMPRQPMRLKSFSKKVDISGTPGELNFSLPFEQAAPASASKN